MTKLQELLGKILTSRINTEKANGTLDVDKDNISQILDIFLAGNKITTDQYTEFINLITPTITTNDKGSETNESSSTSTTQV